MYSINVVLRKSRKPDKPGYIGIRLRDKFGSERFFSTGIISTEEEIATVHKDALLKRIIMLCGIIECLSEKRIEYTIDDVAELFRNKNAEDFENVDIAYFKVNRKLVSTGKLLNKIIEPKGQNGNINLNFCILTIRNLTKYISRLLENDKEFNRKSTLCNYRSTRNTLIEFIGTLPPTRTSIDSEFIRDFQQWLSSTQKLAGSTVSFYLRVLRAILKKAQKDGLIRIDNSWFTGLIKQYHREDSDDKKTALDKEQINAIAKIIIDEDPLMDLSRDLFMFSFYSRGMELRDILNLKKGNIRGDSIVYNKRLTGLQKVIKLDSQALRIIQKYVEKPIGYESSDTIFSTINNYTKSTEYSTYRHMVAQKLTELGKCLNIKFTLKFSMARNTWLFLTQESNLSSMLLG